MTSLFLIHIIRPPLVSSVSFRDPDGGGGGGKACLHRPSRAAAAVVTNWGVTRGPSVFISTWLGQSRGPLRGC